MQFLPSYYQKEYEKNSEKFIRWGCTTLDSANDYIKNHPIDEGFLNTTLYISQVALVALQLYNTLYFAAAGLVTGAALQRVYKRVTSLPRNLSTVGNTIEELWNNKVVQAGTFIGGIVLLLCPKFVVTIICSVATGAYLSSKI